MREGVTKMGAIADQIPPNLTPAQRFYYDRLLKHLNESHPQGWREWPLRRFSYEELFGKMIAEQTEKQILLALPLDQMAEIFGGDYAAMQVSDLRTLHALLLRWEIGRALIVQPRFIHDAIHLIDHYSSLFVNPLVMRRSTQEILCSNPAELHVYCGPGIELRRAPWSRGDLTPQQTVRMWNKLSLQDAIAGVTGPFHECNLFPDF